jgi:rhodanese-related sulfurtransferase
MKGRMKGISSVEVYRMLKNENKPFFLDVRESSEYEKMRLGIGEVLIPLGALRKRLDEFPQDKDTEIVCFCQSSLRGYEAENVLEHHGWKNVKIIEGGVVAWPFPREK